MKSVILYCHKEDSPERESILLKDLTFLYIRAEIVECDVTQALEKANPKEGEIVLNAVEHPLNEELELDSEVITEEVRFAVFFAAKEAKSGDGVLLTREGKTFWVAEDPEKFVPAVSAPGEIGKVPQDAKTWATEEEANKFMKEGGWFPWYIAPASWEVLRITRKVEVVSGCSSSGKN